MLALIRGGSLSAAGERLGVDGSTLFRSLQRIERGVAQALFERTRSGYVPGDMALELARYAERLRADIEAAAQCFKLRRSRWGGGCESRPPIPSCPDSFADNVHLE